VGEGVASVTPDDNSSLGKLCLHNAKYQVKECKAGSTGLGWVYSQWIRPR